MHGFEDSRCAELAKRLLGLGRSVSGAGEGMNPV